MQRRFGGIHGVGRHGTGYGMPGSVQAQPAAPGAPSATLTPPTTLARGGNPNVSWFKAPVYLPYIWTPATPENNIGQETRIYVTEALVDANSGVEIIRPITFSIPITVYALTGSAYVTAGGAFPGGWSPLDSFSVRFEDVNQNRLSTRAGIASAILGTGERPAPVGGTGWAFDTSGQIDVGITPHLNATLTIQVALWCIEFRGPANYTVG